MKALLFTALACWLAEDEEQKTVPQTTSETKPKVTASVAKGQSVSQRLFANMSRARARVEWNSAPNYRVSIRTIGGRRFSGIIVRSEEFEGLVESGGIAADDLNLRPGSFELSYVDGLDGRIVLPWTLVKSVRVTEVLTSMNLQKLDVDLVHARTERTSLRRAQLLARAESALEEAAQQDTAEESTETANKALTRTPNARPEDAPIDWLAKFPPDAGWDQERKEQIEWRRTIMGVFPSEEEQEFLDNFPAWEVAYKAFMTEQARVSGEIAGQEKAGQATEKTPAETTDEDKPVAEAGSAKSSEPTEKQSKSAKPLRR